LDLGPLAKALDRLAANRADEAGWEDLYHLLWGFVVANTYRGLKGDGVLAEDAAQEVMLRILQYADLAKSRANPRQFLSYVRRLCSSVVSDHFRSLGREIPLADVRSETGADALNISQGRVPHPEDLYVEGDEQKRLLGQLTEGERAVTNYLLHGLKPSEIAELLGVEAVTVYRILARLRRSIRKYLIS